MNFKLSTTFYTIVRHQFDLYTGENQTKKPIINKFRRNTGSPHSASHKYFTPPFIPCSILFYYKLLKSNNGEMVFFYFFLKNQQVQVITSTSIGHRRSRSAVIDSPI